MITIVTGPPCGGKSTYVRNGARPGDVIIDMDRIALALTLEGTDPFEYDDRIRKVAREARAGAVKKSLQLAQGERYWGVWIIHTDPSPNERAAYRAMNAQIVECSPGRDVCLERLKERPEVNQRIARDVIETYYAKR